MKKPEEITKPIDKKVWDKPRKIVIAVFPTHSKQDKK